MTGRLGDLQASYVTAAQCSKTSHELLACASAKPGGTFAAGCGSWT